MADRHAEIARAFRWNVPARYNIAQSACRRWAGEPDRIALLWEDESGARAAFSYARLFADASRLSNALVASGVARGDRVAILLPQRAETVVAYLA